MDGRADGAFPAARLVLVSTKFNSGSPLGTASPTQVHKGGKVPEASLSVVVPCLNEAEVIRGVHRRLAESLAAVPESVEFVYVDDGSVDATLEALRELHRDDRRVKVVSLSRNFGQEAAQIAGLAAASGDAVVVADADLQDPPEVVYEMLDLWRNGAEVVYGVRTARDGESLFKRWTASVFYRVQRRLARVDMPLNTGNFRLMDRKVVDAVLAMPDRFPFLRGMTPWIGFRHQPAYYRRSAPLKGRKSRWTLWAMCEVAVGAVLSFSLAPVRFVFLAGVLLLLLAPLAVPLAAAAARVLGAGAEWKIMLVALLCVAGVQLLALGVLGEQLARVHHQTMARPLYFVKERIGFEGAREREGTGRNPGGGEP